TADARYATGASVQNGQFVYAVDTGTANNYIASLSPTLTSYTAGLGIRLKVAHNNTGASTININGLGNKAITYSNASAIGSGDMVAGMIALLMYDGTQFQLLNPFTTAGVYATPNQVQQNSFIYFADTSGTPNSITTALN